MGARFAPFSFGGLLLQSYRPHLTQASCTHRTGIPSTSTLVDSMNTLFVNNEKMKLRCVQMMVRLVAEKRLGEENLLSLGRHERRQNGTFSWNSILILWPESYRSGHGVFLNSLTNRMVVFNLFINRPMVVH